MSGSCEVCGRFDAQYLVLIEGAKMDCCRMCARDGKILRSLKDQSQNFSQSSEKNTPRSLRSEEVIVDDYGKIIRDARNKKGLKRVEVANAINEKESFLEHIEKEKTRPPFKVLRKLEKYLEIKLIEKQSSSLVETKLSKSSNRPLTLADMLEFSKKDKK